MEQARRRAQDTKTGLTPRNKQQLEALAEEGDVEMGVDDFTAFFEASLPKEEAKFDALIAEFTTIAQLAAKPKPKVAVIKAEDYGEAYRLQKLCAIHKVAHLVASVRASRTLLLGCDEPSLACAAGVRCR